MPHVEATLVEVAAGHIKAKQVMPCPLERICELTGDHGLAANIALVLNNARFAARIATGSVKHA